VSFVFLLFIENAVDNLLLLSLSCCRRYDKMFPEYERLYAIHRKYREEAKRFVPWCS